MLKYLSERTYQLKWVYEARSEVAKVTGVSSMLVTDVGDKMWQPEVGKWRTDLNLVQIRCAKPYRYFSVKCLDQTKSRFLSVFRLYGFEKYFFDKYRFFTDICLVQTKICTESVRTEKISFKSVQTKYRRISVKALDRTQSGYFFNLDDVHFRWYSRSRTPVDRLCNVIFLTSGLKTGNWNFLENPTTIPCKIFLEIPDFFDTETFPNLF